jgi:putative chitinase
MTPDQLAQFAPAAARFHAALQDCFKRWGINTTQRQCAFLAQVAHESGGFKYVREIWGPTDAQKRYEPPSKLAQRLGNTQPGDGKRFMGRGLIQITGRANYSQCSHALFDDFGLLLDTPEMLELPEHAASSAGWFWSSRGLNAIADAGDFEKITRRINGGLNGYEDRQRWWAKAKQMFMVH